MATHSESFFNESNANRILADLLESEKTIKTFFNENDRTPIMMVLLRYWETKMHPKTIYCSNKKS